YKTERLATGVNLYAMFFKNEIVQTGKYLSDYDILEVANAPSSRHLGAEFDFSVKLPLVQGLSFSGDIGLDRSVFTDKFNYFWVDSVDENWNYIQDSIDVNGKPIPLTPRYVANLRFSYDRYPWSSSLRWHMVSHQYLDPRGEKSHSLNPYKLLDLILAYTIPLRGGEVEFNLRGLNLLGKDYEPFGWTETKDPSSVPARGVYQPMFIPAAGRSWMVGINLKL
ncbi:MAG: TonB-dependent receptor domain-containing protein, partial [bacterium]